LQLNPVEETYEFEGMKLKRLAFTDEAVHVTYTPPPGWDYAGGETKLTLHPKQNRRAEASVVKMPLSPRATFDEGSLTNEALRSVPAGSTNVQLVAQEKNAAVIEQKETFMVTISYTWYGEDYGRSVMFLNRGKEQLRFQLVSPLPEFNSLQKAFLRSQLSWQNL